MPSPLHTAKSVLPSQIEVRDFRLSGKLLQKTSRSIIFSERNPHQFRRDLFPDRF